MLLLTNFGGTSTDVTLAQVGGTGSLGGPLSLDLSTAGPFIATDPASIIATSPLVSDPNVTNEIFSGAGITDPMTGEFTPSAAGVGSHVVTVDALSFGCPVNASSTIVVNCSNPTISSVASATNACMGEPDIAITTTAKNNEEGKALLEAFNFPFKKQ